MLPELPHELALQIFDFAAVDDDLLAAKALRLVNKECALRFARPVWFVGARTHYFNYLLRLGNLDRRLAVRLLCDEYSEGQPLPRRTIEGAATNAARACSAAIAEDEKLFRQLKKCTKFRV